MFDKLEDLVKRLDEVMQELSEPDVVSDQNRFRNLMKEQNELAPIVEKYKEYKEAKQTIEDSVEMLEEEHDEEMRELLKEELSEAKKNVEQYEEELKVLLLPKDPNDDKNVIVEIRAGAKNFNDVVIVASKHQYQPLLDILNKQGAVTTREQRRWFAGEAFTVSSHYDTAIRDYFKK